MKKFSLILFIILNISNFLRAQNSDPQVSCNAGFQITHDSLHPKTVTLVNTSNIRDTTSDEKVKYEWDFGDLQKSHHKNPIHIYLYPDYYNICLSIRVVQRKDTNNILCESNVCKLIRIGEPKNYNICGNILKGEFPPKTHTANIFRIHYDNTITPVHPKIFDTTGYFCFYQVAEGNYLVKISTPDSNYFPTYFGNSVLWHKSKRIEAHKTLWQEDINLIPIKPPIGTGYINGQLGIDNSNLGTVINVEIILTDINSIPLTYTFTNNRDGRFSFNGIAFGCYKLYADEVGWIHKVETVCISEDKPGANAQITLTWSPALTSTQIININSQPSINLYPVPADNFIYVEIKSQEASGWQFEIYSITGIRVQSSKFKVQSSGTKISFDISHLASGIYCMRITSKDNSTPIIKKFIKE